MNMFQKILAMGALVGAFSANVFAAPVLSFGNSGSDIAQSYNLGDTVSLDFWISGLEAADLGGFDMNLSFNGAVTGYQNAAFSTDLDDSLFYGLAATPTSTNSLNLSGFSLLADLSAQVDALKLFTLVFTASEAGTSTIKLDDFLLADALGFELASASYLAEITVNSQPASVPEPGALGLMLGALALVWGRRRLV
jgi:hypothetical protein